MSVLHRRIGVGNRELVRCQLLQICSLTNTNVIRQTQGAIWAADKLEMRLRIFFNADLLPASVIHHLNFVLFSRYRDKDHDFMEERYVSRRRFNEIVSASDIILEDVGNDEDEYHIRDQILGLWASTDARRLGGNVNTYVMNIEQLQKTFPDYYGNEDEYWNKFIAPVV